MNLKQDASCLLSLDMHGETISEGETGVGWDTFHVFSNITESIYVLARSATSLEQSTASDAYN